MNIGLVSPKGHVNSKIPGLHKVWDDKHDNDSRLRSPVKKYTVFTGSSLGLLILAALTPEKHTITLFDENIEEINFNQEFDLVGITSMTQQATRAYEISSIFRGKGVKVVFGGIHPTVMHEEALKYCDSVVIGEAEHIWCTLLEDFEKGDLKKKYKSEDYVDLKQSPIPRYSLLKGKNNNVGWIQTTRGCPHDCEFCAASKIFGSKYRRKDNIQIINEIKCLQNSFGNVQINFADDNLFSNRQESKKLLKKIIPINIRWFGQSDISISKDDELLKLIHESGCYCLFIGFESLNPHNFQYIDIRGFKKKCLSSYKESIKKIQSFGIGILGAFILGLDYDTPSSFDELADFIINTHLLDAQVTLNTPIPGSRLRQRFENEGRLINTEWNNYTYMDVNFSHSKMSKQEMENGLVRLYKKIYNPLVIQKKLDYFKTIQKNLIKQQLKFKK